MQQPSSVPEGERAARLGRTTSRLLAVLIVIPVLTVVVVAATWIAAHSTQALLGARAYGTRSESALHLRVVATRVEDDQSQPITDEVTARVWSADQRETPSATFTASPGDDGVAVLSGALSPATSGTLFVELSITRTGEHLGEGEVQAASGIQAASGVPPTLGRRGGWLEGKVDGPLSLRVGLVQGVVAVPFPASLVVEVRRDGAPVVGHWVSPPGVQGGKINEVASITDEDGYARFTVIPEQHVIELSVVIPGPIEAPVEVSSWFGHLPVVAGALHGEIREGRLWVSSPIERSWAYVDFYSAAEPEQAPNARDHTTVDASAPLQTWATNVRLRRDNDWFTGFVDLPDAARVPGFAVTSSEPDLQSMALVGWPVGVTLPTPTLDVRSPLLFDGLERARRAVTARRHAVKGYGSLAALLGALCEGACLLLLGRATRRSDALRSAADATHWVPEQRGRALFGWAGACVVLALLALSALSWFS